MYMTAMPARLKGTTCDTNRRRDLKLFFAGLKPTIWPVTVQCPRPRGNLSLSSGNNSYFTVHQVAPPVHSEAIKVLICYFLGTLQLLLLALSSLLQCKHAVCSASKFTVDVRPLLNGIQLGSNSLKISQYAYTHSMLTPSMYEHCLYTVCLLQYAHTLCRHCSYTVKAHTQSTVWHVTGLACYCRQERREVL